ncbi:MAG TPA: RnfABCDGE type electron transport complex subunit A [Caldisericia bacterium]|jgi:electron transport complex protein RnfA|nr:RnfABCDGE type electron transport complex subunit A [Caldisericia bacterium]HXK50952.1 RnfABCDGE type electron transport complex subunit A [Caldisericia bacterium]
MSLVNILIQTIFSQNFIFMRFLGLCPFFGLTNDMDSSIGMGGAVTFVTVMASVVSYFVYYFVLIPFGVEYLQTIAFILTIAVFVQLVEIYLKKMIPNLYKVMGIYLPLITTNCMILGVTLINIQEGYSLLETIFFAFGSSVGFTLAMVLMTAVRIRMGDSNIPAFFKGAPIVFIAASFIAIAFMGLQGLGG